MNIKVELYFYEDKNNSWHKTEHEKSIPVKAILPESLDELEKQLEESENKTLVFDIEHPGSNGERNFTGTV